MTPNPMEPGVRQDPRTPWFIYDLRAAPPRAGASRFTVRASRRNRRTADELLLTVKDAGAGDRLRGHPQRQIPGARRHSRRAGPGTAGQLRPALQLTRRSVPGRSESIEERFGVDSIPEPQLYHA